MYRMTFVLLILLIISGALWIVVALLYPEKAAKSLAQKLEQRKFVRGWMTIVVCLIIIVLFIIQQLTSSETLLYTCAALILVEYIAFTTTKSR